MSPPRTLVHRVQADTDPDSGGLRSTREIEAAAAGKPNLIRKLVLATLPGAITSLIAAIVSAIIGFVVLQAKVGAQDMRIDRIEQQRSDDREQTETLTKIVAQLSETQAHLVARFDAMESTRAKFWQVDWPQLMSRLDRTDSKIDSLIETLAR